MDDGTLLHCRSCGGPIDEALLRAEPLRRLCAACAPSPAP
ncbi:MAG: TraR/DksA C4-type zinc finger protein [Acidimicrobiales bacterium]